MISDKTPESFLISSNPDIYVDIDSNNIIIQIYRDQLRHAVKRLNLLT